MTFDEAESVLREAWIAYERECALKSVKPNPIDMIKEMATAIEKRSDNVQRA